MVLEHEKISFLHLPTPLERMDAISEDLGINLYIKRDDLTGLGTGGNKLRKLEYFLYAAKKAGATALVTVGGPQTNHGRLTAAVAAKFGMKCTIVAVGDYPGEISANILLDRIMGCEVYLVQKDADATDAELEARAVKEVMDAYKDAGDVPYFIPMGGSNPLGSLGYYECAQEITKQAEELNLTNARIIATVGSGGTYMGLFLGLKNIKSPVTLKGVTISPSFDPDPTVRIQKYFDECKTFLNLDWNAKAEDFDITNQYHFDGYNNPVKEIRETIYYVAQKEAIILDPCYTGKCFYALMEMVKSGEIKKGQTIIFIHTGGTAGINGPVHRQLMEDDLKDGLVIKKPAK